MKRRVTLYIGDSPVDLSDESFILSNYTLEELSNPTVVRNSFTQRITLPGTPTNNAVFGSYYRLDRNIGSGGGNIGPDFNARKKVPFTLFDEQNNVLEAGYVKLDGISRKKDDISYKVTLYGGLGSFLYALAYDDNGEKRTLADLKYTGSSADETELQFIIQASNVAAAWNRLNGGSTSPTWDYINFAPAYNGKPSGAFSADKGVFRPALAGMADTAVNEDVTYIAPGGYALLELGTERNEWETRDLRSYLQTPVLSMKKLLQAMAQSYNNGGYTVNLDAEFFTSTNPYYEKAWMTLPKINTFDITTIRTSGTLTISTSGAGGYTDITTGVSDPTANVKLDISVVPFANFTPITGVDRYYLAANYNPVGELIDRYYYNVIVFTAYGYDVDGNIVSQLTRTASTGNSNFFGINVDATGYFNANGTWSGNEVNFLLEGPGITRVRVSVYTYGRAADFYTSQPQPDPIPLKLFSSMNLAADVDSSNSVDVSLYQITAGSTASTYKTESNDNARSGLTITKAMIMSGDKTPADYLLAYCKMFGLVMYMDPSTKEVNIMLRKNFYQNYVRDLTRRVDRSQGIDITPFVFDAKWYTLNHELADSEYADYYESLYGRTFGMQRINTGYSFDATSKALLAGGALKGGCMVLESSPCYVTIMNGNDVIPPVFAAGALEYTLFAGSETLKVSGNMPASATVTMLNQNNEMYDLYPKFQRHGKDGNELDTRDELLFYTGHRDLTGDGVYYILTDDNSTQMRLNENIPCWILDYKATDAALQVTQIPVFSRYIMSGTSVTSSLDFGTPAEVAIPGITFGASSDIYTKYWAAYIADRYDENSRVMRCKVDLRDLQVGVAVLGSFWWYDGAVWALNRIINHSRTTGDLTECEFVQVQDTDNYLTL